MANDFFCLSHSPEVNSTTQPLYSIHSTRKSKLIILEHFQYIAPLGIQLILTSSEPIRQYLPVSLIFMYRHESIYFINIDKIMLQTCWRGLLIFPQDSFNVFIVLS